MWYLICRRTFPQLLLNFPAHIHILRCFIRDEWERSQCELATI